MVQERQELITVPSDSIHTANWGVIPLSYNVHLITRDPGCVQNACAYNIACVYVQDMNH